MPVEDQKTTPPFVTWHDETSKEKAIGSMSDAVDAYDGVQRSTASHRSFLDIESNRSVRTSYQRRDYDAFRTDERIPTKQKQIIKMCMEAYDKVGIIRNVIDLMGDFASQGITLVHPNKTIEKFYRKWFEKVDGKERTERFLNTLYRCGNVVVSRRNAKITPKLERTLRSIGAEIVPEEIVVKKREIPWKYDLLNPLSIDVVGQELAIFAGKKFLELNLSKIIRTMVSKTGPGYQRLITQLPKEIREAINSGKKTIPLDQDRTSVFYYKKDDWTLWANPMIYAILDDIIMLEKMKLADMSALDGAISNVRLWKLGDIDNKILPTKAAINKLRNILASNVGGGTMDLVWGPELNFEESSTQIYRFLGSEKYQPVLTSIYAGLGIPPTLTGVSSSSGGFTNNFISLKTLVERLQYGRDILVSFWNDEIERVRKAMGFRLPAKIHFDQMILSDEAAEKNLLIQLVDRDIISAETVQERFGEIPEIEKIRINREHRSRMDEKSPPKVSPYHNPQHKNDLEKIALTKDTLTPHELGLIPSDETGDHPLTNPKHRPKYDKAEEERKEKEERDHEFKLKQKSAPPGKPTPTGRPEDGRPKNSKDQGPRKQKRVLPKKVAADEFVDLYLWAMDAQKKVSDGVTPAILAFFEKKDIRSLTKGELEDLEHIKLCVLANMEPFVDITSKCLADSLKNNDGLPKEFDVVYHSLKKNYTNSRSGKLTIEQVRSVQASAYATVHSVQKT